MLHFAREGTMFRNESEWGSVSIQSLIVEFW